MTAGMKVGNKETHQKKRKALRRRLRELGCTEEEIEREVAALRDRQAAARRAARGEPAPDAEPGPDAPRDVRLAAAARRAGVPVHEFEAHVDAFHDRTRPDDTGYKPTLPDPLARGAARVGSATLRAAQRQKATTKYEHNHQEMTQ